MLKTIHKLDPKANTQYLNGGKSPEQLAKEGFSFITTNEPELLMQKLNAK